MVTIYLKLNPRAFCAIAHGTKKVEIRANKKDKGNKNSLNDVKRGNYIIFTNLSTNEKLTCIIKRITLYKTIKQLLEKEGVKDTLSSTNDINEGIKSIESIDNYKNLIKKNGVFAIKIEPISHLGP